jgi:hypothetical protein
MKRIAKTSLTNVDEIDYSKPINYYQKLMRIRMNSAIPTASQVFCEENINKFEIIYMITKSTANLCVIRIGRKPRAEE